MTVSQETLTIENAPRDPAQLALKGAYKLRQLATKLGILNNEQHRSAFVNGRAEDMAQVLVAALKAQDEQARGTTAPPQATAPVMPPISIPGATAPVVTTPPTEAAQPSGRGRRSPVPATSPEPELVGALAGVREALQTNTAAIDALAKAVVSGKDSSDQVMAALLHGQRVTLSLLLIIGEKVMGESQGDLAGGAVDNMSMMPDVFGPDGVLAGK